MNKRIYLTPQFRIKTVVAERGFSASAGGLNDWNNSNPSFSLDGENDNEFGN